MKTMYLISNYEKGKYAVDEVDSARMCSCVFTGSLADCYAFTLLKKMEGDNLIELEID